MQFGNQATMLICNQLNDFSYLCGLFNHVRNRFLQKRLSISMKSLHNKVNKEVLKTQLSIDSRPRVTLSFYKYYHLRNPKFFRDHLYVLLNSCEIYGRIYVSYEGVNAQISVPSDRIDDFKASLDTITFLEQIRHNYAIEDDGKSFYKLIIKVRSKIVADGLDDASFDVTDIGIHLKADEFNRLTDDPNTILIDMRNHYESEVGFFPGAIKPDVETFRQALPIVEKMIEGDKDKNIIMYCTGGIRCEKASAYYKHKGFENVFQVEGGIIEYARKAAELGIENKFVGKNFVFDDRLGERISNEIVSNCHQCGDPCDNHVNCANDACHILFLQCTNCSVKYQNTCSAKCKEFKSLPENEQLELRKTMVFNGTKFGKGRYKAHHANHELE
jgi:UPF0176 protein